MKKRTVKPPGNYIDCKNLSLQTQVYISFGAKLHLWKKIETQLKISFFEIEK